MACPRIMCCIPTYKRTWQFVQMIAINCVLAWKLRDVVTFVVADLNDDWEADVELALDMCAAAAQCGMLRRFRRALPESDGWRYWHASVGKNCAHVAAINVAAGDGVVLVELDNDNFVSEQFFDDILENAEELRGHANHGRSE